MAEWSRGPHPQSPPRSRQQTDLLSKQQTELGLARQVKTKPGKQLGKGLAQAHLREYYLLEDVDELSVASWATTA